MSANTAELVTIAESIETMHKAFNEFKTTNDTRLKAIEDTRGHADLEEKLGRLDKAINLAEEAKEKAERIILAARMPVVSDGVITDPDTLAYREVLGRWLKTGQNEQQVKEAQQKVKALSSLTDPDGGIFLTIDKDPEFLRNITEVSPMRAWARVRPIGSASWSQRRRTARAASGGWVGEGTTRAATGTPQVGVVQIWAREQYAYPEAPQTTIDDSEVNVESWLGEEIADIVGETETIAFTTGAAALTPAGFAVVATTDPGNGDFIQEQTSATQDVLIADEFIDLQDSVKEIYQGNAAFYMNRAIVTVVRKFKSDNTQYVWMPGASQGRPSTLFGAPVNVCQQMTSSLDGSAAGPQVVYGDMRQAYVIVDRVGVSVLRDPFTNKGFVGFYSTKRTGGGVVLHEALKYLRTKA